MNTDKLNRRLQALEALTMSDIEVERAIRDLTTLLSGTLRSDEEAGEIARRWSKVIGPEGARRLEASLIWGHARIMERGGFDPALYGPHILWSETWTAEDVARIMAPAGRA